MVEQGDECEIPALTVEKLGSIATARDSPAVATDAEMSARITEIAVSPRTKTLVDTGRTHREKDESLGPTEQGQSHLFHQSNGSCYELPT